MDVVISAVLWLHPRGRRCCCIKTNTRIHSKIRTVPDKELWSSGDHFNLDHNLELDLLLEMLQSIEPGWAEKGDTKHTKQVQHHPSICHHGNKRGAADNKH